MFFLLFFWLLQPFHFFIFVVLYFQRLRLSSSRLIIVFSKSTECVSSEQRTELYTAPVKIFYSLSETLILCVLCTDSDETHYFL